MLAPTTVMKREQSRAQQDASRSQLPWRKRRFASRRCRRFLPTPSYPNYRPWRLLLLEGAALLDQRKAPARECKIYSSCHYCCCFRCYSRTLKSTLIAMADRRSAAPKRRDLTPHRLEHSTRAAKAPLEPSRSLTLRPQRTSIGHRPPVDILASTPPLRRNRSQSAALGHVKSDIVLDFKAHTPRERLRWVSLDLYSALTP